MGRNIMVVVLTLALLWLAGIRAEASEESWFKVRLEGRAVPEEPVQIQVHRRGVLNVTVSLYRVGDPQAFLAAHPRLWGWSAEDLEGLEMVGSFSYEFSESHGVEGVPVTFQDPGLYLVRVRKEDLHSIMLVPVGKLSVLAKRDPSKVLVYVQDSDSAFPIQGAQVSLFRAGKLAGSSETARSGLAMMAMSGGDEAVVLVDLGGNMALAILEPAAPRACSGLPYIVTDKPVVRPGGHVRACAIALECSGRPLALPQGARLHWMGDEGEVALQAGPGGFACADVAVPANAAPGVRDLILEAPGLRSALPLAVEASPGSLQVTLAPVREDQPLRDLMVQVMDPLGLPVEGAEVRISAQAVTLHPAPWHADPAARLLLTTNAQGGQTWELASPKGTTDRDGRCKISLPQAKSLALVRVMAQAQKGSDQGWAMTAGLDGPAPVMARVGVALRAVPPGSTAEVEIHALPLVPGQSLPPLHASLRSGERALSSTPLTFSQGIAKMTFPGAGSLTVSVETDQGNLPLAMAEVRFPPRGPAKALTVTPTRDLAPTNDRVLLTAPPGVKSALVTEEGASMGDPVLAETASGSNWVRTRPSPLGPALRRVVAMANGPQGSLIASHTLVDLDQSRLLTITFPDLPLKVDPGAQATFNVEVKDSQGKPVQAILLAQISDARAYLRAAEPQLHPLLFSQAERGSWVRSASSLDYAPMDRSRPGGLSSLPWLMGPGTLATLSGRAPTPSGDWPRPSSRRLAWLPGPGEGQGSKGGVLTIDVAPVDEPWLLYGLLEALAWQGPGASQPALAVALPLSPLETDQKGKALLTPQLPAVTTTWRLAVQAFTSDGRAGQGLAYFRSSQAVEVSLTGPDRLTQRDTSQAVISLVNLSGQTKEIQLTASGQGLALSPPSPVTLTDGQRKRIVLPITAEQVGAGRVEVVAKTADLPEIKATLDVAIRPHEALVPRPGAWIVGSSGEVTPPLRGPVQALCLCERVGDLALVAAAGLSVRQGETASLTEQRSAMVIAGLAASKAGASRPGQAGLARQEAQRALTQLMGSMSAEGTFSHVPGQPDGDATALALGALTEAAEGGDAQANEALTKALKGAKSLLASSPPPQRAALAYVLAKRLVNVKGTITALAGKPEELGPGATALVAMAAARLGLKDVAEAMVDKVAQMATTEGDLTHWGQDDAMVWTNSSEEATALALLALQALGRNKDLQMGGGRFLLSRVGCGGWSKARVTARAVLALLPLGSTLLAGAKGTLEVKGNGKRIAFSRLPLDGKKEGGLSFSLPQEVRDLALRLKGSGSVVVAADSAVAHRGEDLRALAGSVEVDRVLAQAKGHSAISLGDIIKVTLKVKASGPLGSLVVRDILPPGVIPFLDPPAEVGYTLPSGVKMSLQPETVTFLVPPRAEGTVELAWFGRVTHPGSFHLMPARACPLQAGSCGLSPETRLEVLSPPRAP